LRPPKSPAVRWLPQRFRDDQLTPGCAPSLQGRSRRRGLAKLKIGDKAGSDADLSAARAVQAGIDDEFTRYDVRGRD